MALEPERRPPRPHPSPEDETRTTCLIQGALLFVALTLFVGFVVWIVATRS